MNKPTQPNTSDNQQGISVVELLFAAATIGAAVVVGALFPSKRPPLEGD